MKRILLIVAFLLISGSLFAQNDVTTFLGIPVDGYKAEMIQKLKDKGFTSTSYDKDVLEGEFNGTKVNIYVVTNNNKVYRIMVSDADPISETDIKIRFNNLCRQFANNKRYITPSISEDYTLSEEEDISYEMVVHKKRYQASYYQMPTDVDSASMTKDMLAAVISKYTEEQLSNLTDDMKVEIMTTAIMSVIEKYSRNNVWFMINEFRGKYYISIFYDNGNNRANGEDL